MLFVGFFRVVLVIRKLQFPNSFFSEPDLNQSV